MSLLLYCYGSTSFLCLFISRSPSNRPKGDETNLFPTEALGASGHPPVSTLAICRSNSPLLNS